MSLSELFLSLAVVITPIELRKDPSKIKVAPYLF